MATALYIIVTVLMHLLHWSTCVSSTEDQNLYPRDSVRTKRDTEYERFVNELLTNYDRFSHPGASSYKPTEVKVGLYISRIKFLDEQEWEANFYFRQSWVDPRLNYTRSPTQRDTINLHSEEVSKIWKPDTFFRNALEVREHKHPTPQLLMRLKENGNIWFVQTFSMRGLCPMHRATNYPVDSKMCSITVESYAHTTTDVTLDFLSGSAMELEYSIHLNGWILSRTTEIICDQNYTTATYPCLKITLQFNRLYGYHILHIYLPSILLVLLSWLPLWMESKNQSLVTVKILPGLVALIGLVFLGNGAYSDLPRLNYVTAMHIWMGFSHLLVLLTIVKLTVLDKAIQGQGQEQPTGIEADAEKRRKQSAFQTQFGVFRSRIYESGKYDKISRIAFPALYVLFNILYWSIILRPDIPPE